jgi:hypothetical protein
VPHQSALPLTEPSLQRLTVPSYGYHKSSQINPNLWLVFHFWKSYQRFSKDQLGKKKQLADVIGMKFLI